MNRRPRFFIYLFFCPYYPVSAVGRRGRVVGDGRGRRFFYSSSMTSICRATMAPPSRRPTSMRAAVFFLFLLHILFFPFFFIIYFCPIPVCTRPWTARRRRRRRRLSSRRTATTSVGGHRTYCVFRVTTTRAHS